MRTSGETIGEAPSQQQQLAPASRWSAKRKADAVLRLLEGEDLDTLSRELKVTTATLSGCREVFLPNGIAGFKSREVDGRDEKLAAVHEPPTVQEILDRYTRWEY